MSAGSRTAREQIARPWYREPWPWALMLPPLLAVAGGVTMIMLATRTPGALVVEDYAHIEELTAERFERDRRAVSLGLTATLSVPAVREPERGSGPWPGSGPEPGNSAAAGQRRLEVALLAPEGFVMPRALMLHLRHATNPDDDLDLRLDRFGSVYAADIDYAPGRYTLELMPEDASWRLGSGSVRLPAEILLSAQGTGD